MKKKASVKCLYFVRIKSRNSSYCSENRDVICLNGTCEENARCDGIYQCPYGEDEHWCLTYHLYTDDLLYRSFKYSARNKNNDNEFIPYFPKIDIQDTRKRRNIMSSEQIQSKWLFFNSSQNHQQIQAKTLLSDNSRQQIFSRLTYVCNRGFPLYIPTYNITRCACPPSYYGPLCEYFSDRISIITHLDLTTFSTSIQASLLTIVVHLYFLNTIIDHHNFHVNPLLEQNNPVKHRFYLLYSRSYDFIQHKRSRYFNRTDIINHHPYSVHFDIYSLTNNQTNELGSFHYPIYFDFLPAFRLATILKFPLWFNNLTLDPCASNPCNSNSTCKPILNQNHSYYCSCKSGYSGINCQDYDPQCLSYCNSKAICRPNYRGLVSNPNYPLCICPLGHFGPRCYLENEACKSNPCGQNSTCYPSYDPSGENPIICECSKQFYGDRCQHEKLNIYIRINMTIAARASNIQFDDVFRPSSKMKLHHQQIMCDLQKIIEFNHGRNYIPALSILKIYQELPSPRYFILYIQSFRRKLINLTITPEECPHVLELLSQSNVLFIHISYNYYEHFVF